MKPSIRTLGEILYSPSQHVIPVFQRNYRWQLPDWRKFWQSLVEIQGADKRGREARSAKWSRGLPTWIETLLLSKAHHDQALDSTDLRNGRKCR